MTKGSHRGSIVLIRGLATDESNQRGVRTGPEVREKIRLTLIQRVGAILRNERGPICVESNREVRGHKPVNPAAG
jgi:hypothetical protein